MKNEIQFANHLLCIVMVFLHVALLCFQLFQSVQGRQGFLKDQNEELVEFPPKVLQSFDSVIPVGHLRPLGWQRYPSGSVGEVNEMPDSLDFQENYVLTNKPVAFRKVLRNVPAMENWMKKNYLKDKFGKIEIDVVVKKESFKSGLKRLKFDKFLRDYLYEDLYLNNFVPESMMEELVLPKCLKCGFIEWLMESELWMSSGGTSSLLHSHADHDIHCLLTGRKDFIFIENKYKQVFNYHNKEPYEGAGYSDLDMDQINMFKFKDVADVPWIYSILRPGDCIFVPAGYLHQVRSYGISISYTNHFAPSPDMDFTKCVSTDVEPIKLSDVKFLWVYRDGKFLLSDDKLDAKSTKHYLLMLMRNQTLLTRELFSAFYQEVMTEAKNFPQAESVWSQLVSKTNNASLTRDEVRNLPDESLQQIADILNIPHSQILAKKHDEL